jgi:hypothetical protein
MAHVKVSIRTEIDAVDDNTQCSFYLALPVTLNKVIEMMPFEGTYHYRVKISGQSINMPNDESLWLDIGKENSNDEIPIYDKNESVVYIQAVARSLPNILLPGIGNENEIYPDEQHVIEEDNYLESIGSVIGIQCNERIPRMQMKKKHEGVNATLSDMADVATSLFKKGTSTLNDIRKDAGSAWGAVTSGVGSLFGMSNTLPESVSLSLSNLSKMMEVNTYEDILEKLFYTINIENIIGQPTQYARISNNWKIMGWQKDDPVLDLKTSGVLALHCMLYMAKHFPEQTHDMAFRNKSNSKSKYPFAIVGVNITLLLADIIQLKGNGYKSKNNATYLQLFEDSNAFYKIFSICFIYMDNLWTQNNSVRADFGRHISHIKNLVTKLLSRGPKDIGDFKVLAKEEGMI